VADEKREGGKLVKYQRLEAPELALDNEEGIVNASGPGTVRTLQPGSADPVAVPAPPVKGQPAKGQAAKGQAAKAPAEEQMKLTKVDYRGKMYANNKSHLITFYDEVEVISAPSEDPEAVIDLNRLPQGAMHMQCDQLRVSNRPENGVNNQEME